MASNIKWTQSILRKVVVFTLLAFCGTLTNAQQFANDWIKDNQTYYKFQVIQEGIHRIDYFTLTTAVVQSGIPLTKLKPEKIQVYHMGKEIPIHVRGELDGSFDINDFVEFYANKNDGKLDTKMFEKGSQDQLHQTKSLYSDTAVYFISFLPDTSSLNGKRYTPYTNTSFNTPKYKNYVEFKTIYDNTQYHYGRPYYLNATDMGRSEFTAGEGYRSAQFGASASAKKKFEHFSLENYDPSGFDPYLFISFLGSNNVRTANPDHKVEIKVGKDLTSLQRIWDTTFNGYEPVARGFVVKPNAADTGLDFSIEPILTGNFDKQNVKFSHATLNYPAKFDLKNTTERKFILEPEFFDARHISWTNYRTGYNSPVVYCLSLNLRIEPQILELPIRECRFMTPISQQYDTFYMSDENDIKYITEIKATPLKRYDDHVNTYNYLILTSKQLAASASEYSAYRSNKYTPVVSHMEDLYNSFSYGYHHPLAIRNYCDFLLEKSSTFPPKFMLLLGKGVEPQYYGFASFRALDLIPVYGSPGSDNILTSGLKGSTGDEPAIATGRVTVINDEQARDYLQKVREYESAGNKYWRKDVMHLSGGSDAAQAARILNAMNGNKTFVEDSQYAGNVITFSRNNKSLIDPDIRKSTIDNINSGKNLITFIGHGSASVFDLDVGQPLQYQNVGRYPVCYFNGCSTGNPFGGEGPIGSLSYGLQMMRMKRRGAVAFIAQTSLAEERSVTNQTRVFYEEAFNLHYGEPIGNLLKNTIKRTQSPNGLGKIHSRQLLLQGDPAIILYAPDKPEYQIRAENVTLEPNIVSALADSFILRIKVENLGVFDSSAKPLLKIRRLYPDKKTVREFEVVLPPVNYEYVLDYAIYSKDPSTAGENVFTVEVNPFRAITEYGNEYSNNQIQKKFNIANNGISLVFPERFAIIEKDSVELTFQPLNLFIQNQPFVVELDTSRRFDPNSSSAFRKRTFNENSLGKWKVDLPDYGYDSVAWYWRAYLILGGGQGGAAIERSFTNIKTHPPGWCQTEFPQLAQGTPEVIFLDTQDRRFEFINLEKPIWIDMTFDPVAKGIKEAGFGSQDLNYGVGEQRDEYQNCPAKGLVVMLWDKNTLERFLLPSVKPKCYWGSVWVPHNPLAQPQNAKYQAYYVFDLSLPADQTRFTDLVNLLDPGTHVTAYSYNGISPSSWTPQVRTTFNDLGCIKSDTLTDPNTLYVFRGQKGAAKGTADEAYSINDINDPLTNYVALNATMLGAGSKGSLTSEGVGPVDSWGAVYHWFEAEAGSDDAYIDIYAQNKDGKDTLVLSKVKTSPVNISGLDAEKYRFLYLKATMEDPKFNTCPQLKEWRVTYKKVPEGTIDPGNDFVFHNDTLDEGDSFRFELSFKNISELDFKDSLPIDFKLFAKSDQTLVDSNRIWIAKALLSDSSYRFEYKHDTRGLRGTYQFEMNVNRNFQQPEQILTNNAAIVNFVVLKDRINPLLDVTFDGRHIVNNEIVSPNPFILIVSKDENKLLLQDDTSTFTVMLKYPDNSTFVEFPIGSDDINFIPAVDKNNLAKLEFRPKNLADGTYTLRVQSRDGSNNQAGQNYYEISFKVINEQTATNFYPYPNPFSTSMRFVFTLTGAEVPQDIRISIMTLSGKVVRQITKDELGNLQIGNNISEFAWDGTDQFGDKLANGVYLYKVDITDANGKDIKEANFDEADNENRKKYFKKNIGKIYIMR